MEDKIFKAYKESQLLRVALSKLSFFNRYDTWYWIASILTMTVPLFVFSLSSDYGIFSFVICSVLVFLYGALISHFAIKKLIHENYGIPSSKSIFNHWYSPEVERRERKRFNKKIKKVLNGNLNLEALDALRGYLENSQFESKNLVDTFFSAFMACLMFFLDKTDWSFFIVFALIFALNLFLYLFNSMLLNRFYIKKKILRIIDELKVEIVSVG